MTTNKRIAVAGATGRVGRQAVDVLSERGYDVVAMSRSSGVDVVTGEGLAEALTGVDAVIDAATGASPEQQAATEFFTTAAANLQRLGEQAGVKRIVVVSIIGTDHFTAGYGAAKLAHEQAMLAGPMPVSILRAAQFHEFVQQLVDWGRRGDVSYVTEMRTQLVGARSVAEELVELATAAEPSANGSPISEIGGPREESMVAMARLLMKRRGDPVRIEEWTNPDDPDSGLNSTDIVLPGPDAKLAGPTFEEWLDSRS